MTGQTEAQALLEKLAPYARSVLQEHRTRNKSDSAWHTRRIDGAGLTYGTLRKIVELVDGGK